MCSSSIVICIDNSTIKYRYRELTIEELASTGKIVLKVKQLRLESRLGLGSNPSLGWNPRIQFSKVAWSSIAIKLLEK